MRCSRHLFFALLVAAFFTVSCAAQKSDNSAPPAATNQVKTFTVKGVIEEVQSAKNTLVVKHEAIPGYMPAMTMPIEVRPAREMSGLQAGDTISFRLVDSGKDGWMEGIQVLSRATTPPAPLSQPTLSPIKMIKPFEIGDKVPDYAFTNELGEAISLGQYKGQAVAFTFIFTRCPFPTFCPRMSENFSIAYQKLSAMTNGPANWRLLSLSFDPEFDTPATLKAYAGRYRYDPKRWSFATGSMTTIGTLGDQLGLVLVRESNNINHNLRTAIVDASGRLHKVYIGNEWKVDDFVEEMVKAAAVK